MTRIRVIVAIVLSAVLSPLAGWAQTPSGMVFWSRFEASTALVPIDINDCWNNGCTQAIGGTDTSTGFTWPPAVSGGSAQWILRTDTAGNPSPTPSNIGSYMHQQIQTVTGHTGAPTQAMYMEITQSGCCGQGPQGGGSTYDAFDLYPATDPTDFYASYWMKLQPDLGQKLRAGDPWRLIFDFGTSTADYALTVLVEWPTGSAAAAPYWRVVADRRYPDSGEFWAAILDGVHAAYMPVPLDRWFKLEVYWHRSAGPDGRIRVAADGQVLVDQAGSNIGAANSPIDRIRLFEINTGSSYPVYQWADDLQIWSRLPVASPGDAWYDPPYAFGSTTGGRTSSPYNGTPFLVPGTFEATEFDLGGEGVAYHDVTPPPTPANPIRTNETVQIRSDGGAGYEVYDFDQGEWLNYTIEVTTSGPYTIAVLAANNYQAAVPQFHIDIDGVNVTGTVSVPRTGAWTNYQWVTAKTGVDLSAGQHVLTIVSDVPYFGLHAFHVTPTAGDSTPYNGTPFAVPGTFEATQFDLGGEGVAYHDVTPPPTPANPIRTNETVQIRSDGGTGYEIYDFDQGEWLNYTINVTAAGQYDITVLAANNYQAAVPQFHIEIDAVNVTGTVSVPLTGAWTNYRWITAKTGVDLSAGQHVVRIVSEVPYFGLHAFSLARTGGGGGGGGGTSPDFLHSFETSTTENGFYFIQSKDNDQGGGGRVTLVPTARHGSSAVKLTTFVGDSGVHGSDWWERTDLSTSVDSVGGKAGMTGWWANSIYLPDDFHMPAPGEEGYLLMDWHDDSSQRGIHVVAGQAPFNLGIVNVDSQTIMQVRAYGGDPADGTGQEQRVTIDTAPQKNVWYDFVHYVQWAPDNTGVYRMWMRKGDEPSYRLVFERISRPNMWVGCDVYLKLANYHGPYGVSTSVIHDRIVRGTTAESVQMAPLAGVP